MIGPTGHWFTASELRTSWDDYPAQALVLDQSRNAGYSLVSAKRPAGGTLAVFLYRHDLATSEMLWSVYVGEALDEGSRIAVDGNGNLWVARPDQIGGARGFWFECIRGRDGTKINSMTGIREVGHDIRVQAMAAAQSHMYVAYSNIDVQAKVGSDLVVSVFDVTDTGGMSLYAKQSYSWPISEPADDDAGFGVPSATPHHPVFTDGTIDSQGNFQVAGFYSFVRSFGCHHDNNPCQGADRRYYPVLATLTATASVVSIYIERGTSPDAWVIEYGTSTMTGVARVAASAAGRNFVQILAGTSRLWEVASEQRVGTVSLGDTSGRVEYPEGSGCRWQTRWEPVDITEFFHSAASDRLLAGGVVTLVRVNSNPSSCSSMPATLKNRLRTASFLVRPLWPSVLTRVFEL